MTAEDKAMEMLILRLGTCQDLTELLVNADLVPSKSAGRRAIKEGAIRLNNTKIHDPKAKVFFDEGQWCAAENWKDPKTILITVFGKEGDTVEFRKLEVTTEPGEPLTLNKI